MAVIFSAREVVEAAVEKEKKRKGFYAAVAELSADQEMKDLFKFLTEEEGRHVAAFARIRDSLPEGGDSGEYSADMDAYMDSVIDERLYSRIDSKEFVQQAIDARNVFSLAIGFEKDAILYFREFIPYLSESDRMIVQELVDQEKEHIRRLAEMQRKAGE